MTTFLMLGLQNRDGVNIDRHVKNAVLSIIEIDESITPPELVSAIATAGES